jgi:hypothetical protein
MRIKHLPGQHDQKSHGFRKANISNRDMDYVPPFETWRNRGGITAPTPDEAKRIADRIKSMPPAIRALEPVSAQTRVYHGTLTGVSKIMGDTLDVGIIRNINLSNDGSAYSVADGMYITPEFVGTQIQDHEYLHTLTFRNKLLRDSLQTKYKPPYLYTHAQRAQDRNGEHFVMIMTNYDKNPDVWKKHILDSESWSTKRTDAEAQAQIDEVTRFLKEVRIW